MREAGKVTDEDIAKSFAGTKFGDADPRQLLEQGVLKKQAGYRSGWTLTQIMRELGLISETGNVTSHGRKFILKAFGKTVNV